MPQPGAVANGGPPRSAAEHGYKSGTLLGGPGHLRMTVSPSKTTVEYMRTETGAPPHAAHSYVIARPVR